MGKKQLFLVHFAGGNAYSFRFLQPFLKDFDLIPLELPGRGKRINEPLIKEFNDAAFDIYTQINSRRNATPYIIYGHSMGASLALRTTALMEEKQDAPACIIVSGNPGPGVKDNKNRYLLDQKAFIQELKALGGVSDELLENREIFDFFEPILRCDFEIAERNNLEDQQPVSVPIYAIMGNDEGRIDEIGDWANYTTGTFDYELLEGDHFFINNHAARIAEIIKLQYDQVALR